MPGYSISRLHKLPETAAEFGLVYDILSKITTYATGSGAPTLNAAFVGQKYIDIAASPKRIYEAVDKGLGANDWVRTA